MVLVVSRDVCKAGAGGNSANAVDTISALKLEAGFAVHYTLVVEGLLRLLWYLVLYSGVGFRRDQSIFWLCVSRIGGLRVTTQTLGYEGGWGLQVFIVMSC